MSKLLSTGVFAGFVLAGAGASAQTISDVVLFDTSNDQVIRLTDIDGDGEFLSKNEASALYTDGLGGGANSVVEAHALRVRVEGSTTVAYWNDRKSRAIWRGIDADGNGLIETSEATKFRDIALLDNATADLFEGSLVPTPDGAVWYSTNWNNNNPHTGIFRLEDLNGDGDANDAGESVGMAVFGGGLTSANTGGPVVIDVEAFDRMAAHGNGVVAWTGYSGNFDEDFCVYRFEDKNGDGDCADPGEAVNFFNPTGKNPGLDQNADFASGLLRNQEVWDAGVNTGHNRFRYVSSMNEGGVDVVYVASDAAGGSVWGYNQAGDGLNGLIYRCVDNNLDGDCNDAGEVNLYFDGSSTSGGNFFPDIYGMEASGGSVFVVAPTSTQEVWHLRDLNGDGDAMDLGEVVTGSGGAGVWETSAWGTLWGGYPVPFDATYGYSFFCTNLGAFPHGLFNDPSVNWTTSGVGCSLYSADIPTIHGEGAAAIGTSNFVTKIKNCPGGVPAMLFVGDSSTLWLGSIPLPFDLTAVGYPGCNLYQSMTFSFLVATSGTGPTGGEGSKAITVPNDAGFIGFDLFLQWAVIDLFTAGAPLGTTGLGTVTIE